MFKALFNAIRRFRPPRPRSPSHVLGLIRAWLKHTFWDFN